MTLVGAFFFPVGLIMLVLTGQELVTANFSEWTSIHKNGGGSNGVAEWRSGGVMKTRR